APPKPVWFMMATTRSGVSSRNTPMVRISRGRRLTMSATLMGDTIRGEGAKTKPRASAPMATARRASSSLVVPQIFTNTEVRRYRAVPRNAEMLRGSAVQPVVGVVVVGGEVEQAVAGVGEEDHPLGALFLGQEGLVDSGPDGVGRLRRGDGPLDPGELHG